MLINYVYEFFLLRPYRGKNIGSIAAKQVFDKFKGKWGLYVDIGMKILFLDIDGVLNSKFWSNANEREISDGKFIDSEKVLLLSKIISETDAKIVLHSGWRFWFDDNMNPLREEAIYFIEILKAHNLFIYDKTPDLTTEEIRRNKRFSLVKAREILLWLSKYDRIEEYVVLDDLYLNNQDIEVHQIKTDADIGLSKENVITAIMLLNKGTI